MRWWYSRAVMLLIFANAWYLWSLPVCCLPAKHSLRSEILLDSLSDKLFILRRNIGAGSGASRRPVMAFRGRRCPRRWRRGPARGATPACRFDAPACDRPGIPAPSSCSRPVAGRLTVLTARPLGRSVPDRGGSVPLVLWTFSHEILVAVFRTNSQGCLDFESCTPAPALVQKVAAYAVNDKNYLWFMVWP